MARQGDNSYLVLTDTTSADSGSYMASASNSYGESKSYGRLTVHEQTTTSQGTSSQSTVVEKRSTSAGSPRKGQPPEFKKLFYDKHVQAGETVRIDSVIIGSPKPRIKWFFNDDIPEENTRCIMAGDTYSFIIEGFEEKNCGRYTIQAENQYGKATCSAEILFEGALFSSSAADSQVALQAPNAESSGNIITEEIYSKTADGGDMVCKSISEVKTIKTESKSIETLPVHTRDLSIQSIIPQMKDMSSQSNMFNTKDTGIQINPDQRDKGSQLESIRTRDESSQWHAADNNELKRFASVEPMAPLITSSIATEKHFSSVNESTTSQNSTTTTHSYSYNQCSSNNNGGSRLRIETNEKTFGDGVIGISIKATPDQSAQTNTHLDYSTTLIKDINQNRHQFEPVELIVKSSRGPSPAPFAINTTSSNTYITDVEEVQRHHHHQHHHHHHLPQSKPMQPRFEPVNLIIQKPTCGLGRSGSLPPVRSRINYKSSTVRNDFDQIETDEETSFYYINKNKENMSSYNQHSYGPSESKMSYYKEIERKSQRPSFKPVELILDASTISDSDRVEENIRYGKYSLINQQQQQQHRSSVSSIDERFNRQERRMSREASYPTVEMTIDLKSPPTIDVPLKSVNANEGQVVKLECVVSGKPNPTVKWYKEGNEIEPNSSDDIIVSFDSNLGLAILVIKQVKLSDAGRFTCVARNAIGSCSTSASVSVQGNPLTQTQSFSTQQSFSVTSSNKSSAYPSQHQPQQHISRSSQPPSFITKPSPQTASKFSSSVTESYYTTQTQHQEPPRSVRTSTHVIPDQGNVPLMQINRKPLAPRTCQSSQQIMPTYSRSKSFDDESDTLSKFGPNRLNYSTETNKWSTSSTKTVPVGKPSYYTSLTNLSQQAQVPPRFIRKLGPLLTRRSGQPVKLEFEVADCPDSSVSWFKDGLHVNNTPHTRITSKFGVHTLIIPDAYPEDSGRYKAVINSPLGNLDTTCELIVEGDSKKKSPSPRSQSDSPMRKVGFYQVKPTSTTFNNPNQVPITYQQAVESYATHKPLSFFTQTEVKPTQNNIQMMPSIMPQRSVSLNQPPSMIHSIPKPQFVKHLQNQTIKQGNRALMQCIIKSTPDTEIKWYHDGNQINLTSYSPRFPVTYDKFTGLCSLSILDTNPRDQGQYTCVATNPGGSETSTAWVVVREPTEEKIQQVYEPQIPAPFKVNARPADRPRQTTPLRFGSIESAKVEVPKYAEPPQRQQPPPPPPPPPPISVAPKPVEIVRAYQKYPEEKPVKTQEFPVDPAQMMKPRIIEPLKNVEFVEGGQAMFECRVEGCPLNIQWYKGGRELFNQFRYKMSHDPNTGSAKLHIATVLEDDAGDYTCRISNPIGEANTSSKLTQMVKQPVDFWNKKPISKPLEDQINKNRPLMEELGQRQRERQSSQRPRQSSHSERMPSANSYPDDVFEPHKHIEQPGPSPAKIVKGLKNEQFKENDTIVLKALISGNPYPRASWYKNNQPLVMSQRHTVHNDDSKKVCGVKIKNAKPEDSGVYSLVVENPYGADDSTAQVVVIPPTDKQRQRNLSSNSVYEDQPQAYVATIKKPLDSSDESPMPPKFIVGLQPNNKIREGEPIILSCQVEGFPKPSVNWLKDGKPLPTSLRFSTNYSAPTGVATLTVTGTLPTDCGNYTAVAENPVGKAYTTSQVFVKESGKPLLHGKYDSQEDSQTDDDVPLNRAKPPKVIHGLQNIKQTEGEPVNMACKIDGFPKPTLTWLKNGAPIPASNRFNTTYDLNTGVARLKISDSVLNDAGVYSVLAENKAGSDQTNGRLDIEKESNIDSKPIFSPQYQPQQQAEPAPVVNLRRGPSPSPQYVGRRGPSPQTQMPPPPPKNYKNLTPTPESVYVPNDDEDRPLSPPKVIVPLKDLKVSEGAPACLMTKIIGYPIPAIKWLHNNRPINESSRFTTDYDHTTGIASFKINSTQLNDAGTYTAIADNPAGTCDTTNSLKLTPSSLVDTTPIVNPNAFRYLEKPTHERPRDDSNDPPVSAIKPPRFIVPLSNIKVDQGTHADLLCKLEGYPFPTVSWYKDNKPLPASNRMVTNYNLNTGLVYLKIADAQMGDAGYYTAVAENKAGQDQTFCNVLINEQPNIDCTPMVNPDAFRYLEQNSLDRGPRNDSEPKKPPKVIIPLDNVQLEEGQKVLLSCKIEGNPRPKLTWFKDGKILPAANRFTTNYDYYTNIATLKIDNALKNDVGTYVVLAENEVGKDQSVCSVFVQEMPNVDSTPLVNPDAFKYLENPPANQISQPDDDNENLQPPVVIVPLKDMELKEGEPVLLICKIIGKPKPKLTWYKNDEPLMASQRYDIDYNLSTCVGILNIKLTKPIDIGTYKVVAENCVGQCETSCQLFVQAVPNIDETPYVNPKSFRSLDGPKLPTNIDADDGKPKQPALIVKPLEDQECFEGDTVMFICEVTGNPKPVLNWTKNGNALPAAQRLSFNYIINEGRALCIITNVKRDDEGKYTLTAKNLAGEASTNANLKVKMVPTIDDTSYVNPDVFQKFEQKKKPETSEPSDPSKPNCRLKIVEPLKDFHLVEGTEAVFYCKIDAYPKADTLWFKNNEPLMASQRHITSFNMHSGIATLIIRGATSLDKGTYKCVASNIAGTEETSANLIIQLAPNIDDRSFINPDTLRHLEHFEPGSNVEESPDDKYKKPYFVKVPKSMEVPVGSPVRLDCLAFGRPTPVLTWYFNGVELKEDQGHKTIVNEEGVHSLLIDTSAFPDSGTYSCVARNIAGEASFSIDLKVVDKDAHIAPYFIEHLNNVIIPEGKDTVLSATCSGKPMPIISWQKNDEPITSDKEYRIDTNGGHSKLFIQNASKKDEGWYQCSAINSAGSTITKTKVTVIPFGAINTVNPDLSHLYKQPPPPEVPGFVQALQKLKHVNSGVNPDQPPKEPNNDPLGQNFGSIWSKDELQDEETMYDKNKPIPPKFKTHFKAQLNLRERDTARYEAKLIPIGDPTMKIEWFRNGEPLRSAARYEIKYDFGLVSLNLLWTYPEDDGIYECVATNHVGQDKTRAELKCKGNRSIIYDTQLPDGMEGYLKIQERDDKLKQAAMIKEEAEEEAQPDPCPPEIVMKLEDAHVDEGDMCKFMAKITGYPKPRVTWFVNKTHAISGSRFKLKFDGMIHYLDIPKTSKLDEGVVRCYAKNIHGEVETSSYLKINPKADFRSVLKNAKTGERVVPEEEVRRERMTTPERTILDRLPMLNPHVKHQQKPADNRHAPVFTAQLEPLKVNEGISVTLLAEFTGVPKPEVFWYKDGFEMQSSEDFHIESTDKQSTLKIKEAFKSDSGMYQVKLFNEVGLAQCKAYLTVTPANLNDLTPTILLHIKNITVNSGDPVKFQAQAIGNPTPLITWYKDDEKLELTPRFKCFQEENTYTLLIFESLAADSGCYECVAENAHGKVYTRAYLNVIGDLAVQEQPIMATFNEQNVRSVPISSKFTQPAIEAPIRDQIVKEGSSVRFECDVSHSEQATVEWFKEDKLIKQSKYFNMQSNNNKHQLLILEAFPEDEGQYKCVVKNPAGQITTSAFLKIEQIAQIPVIINQISDLTVDENQPAEFNVKVEGDPLQVEWSKDGQLIKDGVNYKIHIDKSGISSLKLKQVRVKDAGTYKIRAFNTAGSVESTANLIIKSMLNATSETTPIPSSTH